MGNSNITMKTVHLLLLSILGVALVCAEVHAEDQYTEDADVVAVDDSAAAMEDLDEEMEDTRRAGCSAGFTHYKANFDTNEPLANGFTGTFKMKICNDGSFARYKSDFSGPFDTATTNLNYHLHSKYVEGSSDLGSTSGHYDPTYKCGGASSFKASVPNFCSADDYTPTCSADKTKCELGDTSSKLGQLEVSGGEVHSGWSAKDMNPPRIEEYSETGGATGATFSSVIFHFCTSGTGGCSGRLFGGFLQKTTLDCPHHFYRGVFDGSPINGGVTGKFNMRICKDGSMAKYNGKLNIALATGPAETSLKYHVHTKYDPSDVLNTGGHYDPTYKCGGKSANQGNSECEGSYPTNGYELGDLSGRNGEPTCTNGGECTCRVIDTDPPHNCDFFDSAGITGNVFGNGQGNQFASIVFHRKSPGAKYFGVALEKVH